MKRWGRSSRGKERMLSLGAGVREEQIAGLVIGQFSERGRNI